MPKYDLAWHTQDIADELKEYSEARSLIEKWSELSDLVYTHTRAEWSGHTGMTFPFNKIRFYFGALYMFPKYSLRWNFFNRLGKKFDKNLKITEVRNPKKMEKLDDIAIKYNLGPELFKAEAQNLMRWWIFLK